ncbi:MAG: trypsin-like serine protease [Myxococcales bacterium]|nr:trypsin-like serine protease [Myxococcales bacterium]
MKAKLMVLLLLVAALLFITACGEGVIGEQRAPEDETEREPFVRQGLDTAFNMVGLLRVDTNGICTGTLIAPSVVLTAYHCRGTTVTFQAPGMSRPYKVVAGYGSRASDWAVLKLEADVASGKPLPLATVRPRVNTKHFILGYGSNGDAAAATRQRGGYVRYTGRELVNSSGATFDEYRADSTQEYGPWPPGYTPPPARSTVACPGDSGGPVVAYTRVNGRYQWAIFGALSTGDGQGSDDHARCRDMENTYYAPMADHHTTIGKLRDVLQGIKL